MNKEIVKPVSKKPAKPRKAVTAKPEIDYEKLSGMVAGKLAPVFMKTGKETDTRDMEVGQIPDITMKDGDLVTGGLTLEPVDKPLHKAYLDDLAFMEEEITIMLNETTDENAENPVIVGNNGIFKQFFRGVPTRAKRKFVDGLIVKSSRVSTPEVQNGGGERTFAIRQHPAQKFPFTLMEDRNPKGIEWLRRRMAEPV